LHRVNLPSETATNGFYADFYANSISGVSNIDATDTIYNKQVIGAGQTLLGIVAMNNYFIFPADNNGVAKISINYTSSTAIVVST